MIIQWWSPGYNTICFSYVKMPQEGWWHYSTTWQSLLNNMSGSSKKTLFENMKVKEEVRLGDKILIFA